VLDQVEEGGLGPMEVLEDDDERSLGGERLEQLPDRPVRLLRRGGGAGQPEELREALHDDRRVGHPPEEAADLPADLLRAVQIGDTGDRGEDLDDRPVRDAVAVGEAPAVRDDDVVGEEGDELLDET
jgi:hypothetical protein